MSALANPGSCGGEGRGPTCGGSKGMVVDKKRRITLFYPNDGAGVSKQKSAAGLARGAYLSILVSCQYPISYFSLVGAIDCPFLIYSNPPNTKTH